MSEPWPIFPADWPLGVRRAFLLTLPVSGPLYLAALVAASVTFCALGVALVFGTIFIAVPGALLWFGAVTAWEWLYWTWRP